jgi:hypothetical protein
VPGPIWVRTAGGLSAPVNPRIGGESEKIPAAPVLDRIYSTAEKGTPRDAFLPSANLGQTIVIEGANLVFTTGTIFTTIDAGGSPNTVANNSVIAASSDGRFLALAAGPNAFTTTGPIALRDTKTGLGSGRFFPTIQIVPELDRVDVLPFRPGKVATFKGRAFIENDLRDPDLQITYALVPTSTDGGQTVVLAKIPPLDPPGVEASNDTFSIILPADVFEGEFQVETNGGTTLKLRKPPIFTAIEAVTTSGTPANAAEASAVTAGVGVAGQKIVIHGANLNADCEAIFTKQIGDTQFVVNPDDPNPSARLAVALTNVAADGLRAEATLSSASITTGAVLLRDTKTGLGSRADRLLQVVPVIKTVTLPFGWPSPSDTDSKLIFLAGSGFHAKLDTPVKIIFDGPNGTKIEVDPALAPNVGTRTNGQRVDVFIPKDALQTKVSIRTSGGQSADFDVSTVPIGGTPP